MMSDPTDLPNLIDWSKVRVCRVMDPLATRQLCECPPDDCARERPFATVPPTQPPAAPEAEHGPLSIACPACKKPAGERCHTVIDGVEAGWTHDARYEAHSGFRMAPWSDDDPDATPENDASAFGDVEAEVARARARGVSSCPNEVGTSRCRCAPMCHIPADRVAALLERVRVVEGERDAAEERLRGAYSIGAWADLTAERDREFRRAESAEAALSAIKALDRGHSSPCRHPDDACVCVVSIPLFDLRALLAGGEER